MSYLYTCQECWKTQKDGNPRLYMNETTGHAKTVCTKCLHKLEKRDKEDKNGQI